MITDENINRHVKSQYLEFEMVGDTGKTTIWDVLSKSNGFILGKIKWYPQWRQYCFFPTSETVFNHACLKDIHSCIKELMAERRGK